MEDKVLHLINCSSRKRDERCEARLLYDKSTLFRYLRDFLEKYGYTPYCILSAKYGLVHPTDVIDPYNVTLKGQSKDAIQMWTDTVIHSIRTQFPNLEVVHMWTSNDYDDALIPELKRVGITVYTHLKGLGIGCKVKYLKDRISGIPEV